MKTHELISELVITNNNLSVLLEFLEIKGIITKEEFNRECRKKLEITFPFSSDLSIEDELRGDIQEYLKNATNTRYNS